MKTKTDKKVNRWIRQFNRELRQDVFKNRFEVRQYQKVRHDGESYYLYQLIDNLQPERNYIIYEWIRGGSILSMRRIWEEMNNFIIYSNFWELYWKEGELKV